MWMLYAVGSAFFAGVTSILAKCGIRETDSHVATAIRTVVVVIFSWLMVFVVGSQGEIRQISGRTMLFLVLSGLATGASWLCYYRALQLGDINKVTPVDKSSTVITILLSFLVLGEGISWGKAGATVLVAAGTFLMIGKNKQDKSRASGGKGWLFYAALSAVFASLTAILGKIGISGVESNLGTAIRTVVVLIMAWGMVLVTGKAGQVKRVSRRELAFLCVSGAATGISWLCYYRALKDGAASVVVSIDKLSILVTIAFSRLGFGEKLSPAARAGLVCMVAGTLLLAFLA